jgi:hypothetical protein
LEILNRGNERTFCNSRRVEVLDITLGTCELLERIKDWEVSSEPSLSDHRHIMFKLVGSVPASFFRDPGKHQLGLLSGGPEEQAGAGTQDRC